MLYNQIVEENCAGACNQACLADDSEFVLIKPENYAALRTNQVFEWEQIPNAISYQLQVPNELLILHLFCCFRYILKIWLY